MVLYQLALHFIAHMIDIFNLVYFQELEARQNELEISTPPIKWVQNEQLLDLWAMEL